MTPQEYTQRNEGCRLTAYQDSVKGVWTIGYGVTGPNIGPGVVWTQQQADDQFNERYNLAQTQAKNDLGSTAWAALDMVRQAALTDMAYQMGGKGLLDFSHMLASIRSNSWQAAHDQCLESAYARQTPARANRNANMFLNGQWPGPF